VTSLLGLSYLVAWFEKNQDPSNAVFISPRKNKKMTDKIIGNKTDKSTIDDNAKIF